MTDAMHRELLTDEFCQMVRTLVTSHHSVYPWLPPQGIFFEALIRQAFWQLGWPGTELVESTPNSPEHDLLVGHHRVSIKSETGKGTRPDFITITKLCTTEREPWDAATLVERVLSHLSRYDRIVMLRAIWRGEYFHYQLLEIPIGLLAAMRLGTFGPVGRRLGRRSIGGDISDPAGTPLFHVHFDGSDGKCQVRRLAVARTTMFLEWDHRISPRLIHN